MASILKVDKLDPQSGTALELGTSGDTVSLPSGATLDISASTLTPPTTMPASSGANLTALAAGNISTGTLAIARGGTGAATANNPGFAATNNSAQSISDNTQTIIQFNTEIFDSDSTYDTSAYRFTPAVAGKYYWYIDVSGYSDSDDGIEKFNLRLLKNGTAVYQSYVDYGGTADAIREPQQSIVGVVDLDDNDYIEASILVVFESASSFNLQGGTTYNRFGAYRIIGA